MRRRTRMTAAAQISSGETALQAGDLDKALENFQRAAQLAPGQADAHYGLARAYLARNQPSRRLRSFRRCCRRSRATSGR